MDSTTLSKSDRELVHHITDESLKLSSMITKILDVDAIESGQRNVRLEVVDINELWKNVEKDCTSRAAQKKMTISTKFETGSKALADRFYTTQIIENLMSNAIKFSKEGTQVSIGSRRNGQFIRLSIKDQGPGFSRGDEKKLFKKFQRLSAKPTSGEESVGLGLNIVKQYTELMHGEISYHTQKGEGTTFYIDLPKAKD
jgi:signal transduction histidine kinase